MYALVSEMVRICIALLEEANGVSSAAIERKY